MKITTTISGQDLRRLADLVERRIRERIAAQSHAPARTNDNTTSPSSAPRTRRDTRRS